MKTISLNGTWRVTGKTQNDDTRAITFDGSVPGCVQLDLAENGYLPRDLYMGKNMLAAEKYECYEWKYEREFYIEKAEKNTFIVFEGVDCLAEYFINGKKIGESENMLIAHEFPIDSYISEGKNTLSVYIKSATLAALDEEYDVKVMSSNINLESRHIRKPPHSYGWDIMPRAVTAGLWRGARIEVRDKIYFSQKFMHTRGDECMFFYTLCTDVTDFPEVEIKMRGACGEDSKFQKNFRCKRKFGHFTLKPENAKRWFPYGYGDANIYDCDIEIYYRGEIVHSEPFSFGVTIFVP